VEKWTLCSTFCRLFALPSANFSPHEADIRVQPAARIKNAAATFANQVATELNGSLVKKKSHGLYVRLAAGLALIGTHTSPKSFALVFFSGLAINASASDASTLTQFFSCTVSSVEASASGLFK
jgi:hypothetical protein